MSHHLDNLVKIDASSWQAFWYCSLRNPLKAPTWTQKALSTISFFVGGFFFVALTKAWDVEIEDGKYQLLNPKEMYKFKEDLGGIELAKAALKVEKLFILRVVFNNHCKTFMDVLGEKYEKFKNYHEPFSFSSEQKKELAQMKRLHSIVKKTTLKDGSENKELLRDIAPIWEAVLNQQEEMKTL